MQTKNQYQELAKKHKLPDYNKLNNNFEISNIEETEFLLREIIRKIAEKIESYTKVLNNLLQPEANYSDMYEASALSEKERDNAFKLLKKLMHLDRYAIEALVDNSDESMTRFIKSTFEDWPTISRDFLFIINKLKLSWLEEIKVKTDVGYLG